MVENFHGPDDYIAPKDAILGPENDKKYLGFVDNSKDFRILWGGGQTKGQKIESNSRMFFQLFHLNNKHVCENITFKSFNRYDWNQKLTISSASNDDVVRMKINEQNEKRCITFEGTKIPTYYSRWFPPRPSETRVNYEFFDSIPEITINYEEDDSGIISQISIFLVSKGQNRKIAIINGDLRYSIPHVEIFSLLPNDGIFVLRFWLYWIHKNFTDNTFENLRGTSETGLGERNFVEDNILEIPDVERFDFIIDTREVKIIWYGTDFHYQEYWGKVKDNTVNAKIAGGFDLVTKSIELAPLRLGSPNFPNPIESLKNKIQRGQIPETLLTTSECTTELNQQINDDLRALNIKNHVPYVKNTNIDKSLVSSIVSEII